MGQAVPRPHHSDGMKRRLLLLLIAVFLVTGGVVNVAVAWYCQSRSNLVIGVAGGLSWRRPIFDLSGHSSCSDCSKLWKAVRRSGWSQTPDAVRCRRRFGVTDVIASAPEAVAIEQTCGWPLRSLRCRELFVTRPPSDEVWGILPYSGSRAPLGGPHPGFPVRPLCLGFAVNSGIFALPLFLAWLALMRYLKVRRIGRDRCPSCGYPRGHSDVCSECGKPSKPNIRP